MKTKEKNSRSEKEKDIIFIRAIAGITIKSLCEEEKTYKQNFYTMNISEEKLHNIKLNIDKRIKEAYIEYDKDNSTL